jgi:ligand-binding sensor domain-containing protein
MKIACYFEVSVEELFGWRMEDTGERRPLLVLDPKTGQVVKLVGENRKDAIQLAMEGSDEQRVSQVDTESA